MSHEMTHRDQSSPSVTETFVASAAFHLNTHPHTELLCCSIMQPQWGKASCVVLELLVAPETGPVANSCLQTIIVWAGLCRGVLGGA